MSETYWNERLEFLKAIRTGWCNEDYIEFLVEKVWKINRAVNILDFGCGFGYVGLLLLPVLPEGSTYTGIDISEALLNEAEDIFKNSGYTSKFIKADLKDYEPEENYDIAISQAVLRHIPDAKNILEKMVRSVAPGGLVICMEGDLELEKVGQYFSGLDYIELGMAELYRKMYTMELNKGGRDYRIGVKIPLFMQELGLHNIGVRMNDSVKLINPNVNNDDHIRQFRAMAAAWGWDKQLSEADKVDYINDLMARGLNQQEAEMFLRGQLKISDYVMRNRDSAYILQEPCTLISYGTR